MSRTRNIGGLIRVNGRTLSAGQLSALRAAARAETAGRATQARQLRLRLEAQLGEAGDADWLAGALRETARLEDGRGAKLEQAPGRVRVSGRDGIETLRAAGALNPAQLIVATRYRDRFENAQPRIGSGLVIRPGAGRGQPELPERIAVRMAQARRELDLMEQAVATHYASKGRPALAGDALLALREVAGLGRTIRDLAGSGARRAALTARLGEALSAVSPLLAGASGGPR